MLLQQKKLVISLAAVAGLALAAAAYSQTSTQAPPVKPKVQAPAQQAQPQAQPPAQPSAPSAPPPPPPPGGMGAGMGRGMGHGHGGMMAGPGMHGGMMAQLSLTQAQKDQLKAFRDQQQKDTQALREKMRAARQKLQETMKADVPDENAVRAAAGTLAALQADRAALRARAKGQFMKVLTPEQQAQVKEARARVAERARRQMMRHNRMMRERTARQWRGWL